MNGLPMRFNQEHLKHQDLCCTMYNYDKDLFFFMLEKSEISFALLPSSLYEKEPINPPHVRATCWFVESKGQGASLHEEI